MKTIRILNYIFVIALGFFAVMFGIDRFSNKPQQAGTATLYTEEYCKDIIGFNGDIPMEINIVDGKIESINILNNDETPGFLRKVTNSELLENFYGLTPKEAIGLEIDAVSGATYSSTAIIKSVKRTMDVYCKQNSPWTWQLFGIIGCAVVLCILSLCKKKCDK
jgi:uncharacterized protein with FMN-binding domain